MWLFSLSLYWLTRVVVHPSEHQVTVHPQTGKKERVFVDLVAIYPTPNEAGTELSFEELWALNRGWLEIDWDACDDEMMVDAEETEEVAEPVAEPEDEDVEMEDVAMDETDIVSKTTHQYCMRTLGGV